MSRCQLESLVDRHFAGSIATQQELRLREHLPGCDRCRKRYQRQLLFSKLDPHALSAEERLARGLGLGGPWRRLRDWLAPPSRGPMLLAAVAAACLLFLVIRPSETAPEFQPRGSAAPAFWAYRVAAGKTTELESEIAPSDELAFAYLHPAAGSEAKFLLVFGVDEHRHVYWYHPGWIDPATTPTAVAIRAGKTELGEAIAHDLDGGELTLYAVFADAPVSVRDVESSLETFTGRAAWSRKLRIRPNDP